MIRNTILKLSLLCFLITAPLAANAEPSVIVDSHPFSGNTLVQDQTVYVELIPFLQMLNLTQLTFNTGDLMEGRDGRAYVSLEGAAVTLGGSYTGNVKNQTATFNLDFSSESNAYGNSPGGVSAPSPSGESRLSIYINNQPYYGPYFVSGHDIYAEFVPFMKALNLKQITFFFPDLKETQNGRAYISLQGLASSLNGALKVNWETGAVDFNVTPPPAAESGEQQATYQGVGGPEGGDEFYYAPYYPYAPYYGFFPYYAYDPFWYFYGYGCYEFWCAPAGIVVIAPPPYFHHHWSGSGAAAGAGEQPTPPTFGHHWYTPTMPAYSHQELGMPVSPSNFHVPETSSASEKPAADEPSFHESVETPRAGLPSFHSYGDSHQPGYHGESRGYRGSFRGASGGGHSSHR